MPVSTVPYAGLTSPLGGSVINSGTTQNSTSGTSIDFTGIPSWVQRITVMLSGVSTSGTSGIRFQVMVGGTAVTTNYTASSFSITNAVANAVGAAITNGFPLGVPSASSAQHGQIILSKLSSSVWVGTGNFYDNLATERITTTTGRVFSLSSAVDGIRVTTTGGTDTFDAGTINILYE